MFLIKEETFSAKLESTDLQMRTLRWRSSCFNPLQTKRQLRYLKTQSVPRC